MSVPTTMSPQIEFLQNVIASSQTGNEAALALLRRICRSAVENAPPHDLITLGQCLVHIGREATRNEDRRN